MARARIITMTGYYRVSTKAEAQKSSFKNQPAYFRTLLRQEKYKNYRAADKFYCDWGTSGTKLNRPGFKELLEDAGLDVEIEDKVDIPHPLYPDRTMKQRIYKVSVNPKKKPKFEEIWIKSTSRFARNINAYEILAALRLANVFVYFIDLDLSTRNLENMSTIRAKLSEDMSYSEGLSRGRKIIQIQYEEENRLIGCPYGYDYHKKTKDRLPYYTINPTEGEVVRKIFQYCIEGLGAKATSKVLAAEGYFTKQGKPFAVSTIKKILTNEKYMGLNPCGKYTTGALFEKLESAKIRDDYQERLAETPNLPAIVTPEIWYKAQEAQKSRVIISEEKHVYGLPKPMHPFKDILICGSCGNHFIYDNNAGNGFFRCSTKRKEGSKVCNCCNVFVHTLETFIEKLQKGGMHEIIESDYTNTIHTLTVFASEYFKRYSNPSTSLEVKTQLDTLQEQLNQRLFARDQLLDLLQAGEFGVSSIASFKEKLHQIEEDIKSIEGEIKNLQISHVEYKEVIDRLFEVIFEELKIFKTKKEIYTNSEILSMLSKIKVFGKTQNRKGGQPPQPILIPVLKTTEEAQGLIQMGQKEFTYKLRNHLPNYEAPREGDAITAIDDDTKSMVEKAEQCVKETKSHWPVSSSKYLYTSLRDFEPDLGFENLTILSQLEEHIQTLYQSYLDFNAKQN